MKKDTHIAFSRIKKYGSTSSRRTPIGEVNSLYYDEGDGQGMRP